MPPSHPFCYFKTSPEVIRLAVMLSVRFRLSLRQVQDLLHERGIDVTQETVRLWWNRFGPVFAGEIRRGRAAARRGIPQWGWHLGETFVRINDRLHDLWRAVDPKGKMLDAYISRKRDRKAALRFLRGFLRWHCRPETIVTDRVPVVWDRPWRPRGPAAPGDRSLIEHPGENAHQPFRRLERAMIRFRRMRTLQKFSAAYGTAYNHLNHDQHLLSRTISSKNVRRHSMRGGNWQRTEAGAPVRLHLERILIIPGRSRRR